MELWRISSRSVFIIRSVDILYVSWLFSFEYTLRQVMLVIFSIGVLITKVHGRNVFKIFFHRNFMSIIEKLLVFFMIFGLLSNSQRLICNKFLISHFIETFTIYDRKFLLFHVRFKLNFHDPERKSNNYCTFACKRN